MSICILEWSLFQNLFTLFRVLRLVPGALRLTGFHSLIDRRFFHSHSFSAVVFVLTFGKKGEFNALPERKMRNRGRKQKRR
jgi:hypothetical protein